MSTPKLEICPYCGAATPTNAADGRCVACRGLLDPLSRQRTQNDMGPWSIRDAKRPFRPGCSHASLLGLVERGVVGPTTVVRGPSTRQFWRLARSTPGVGHLFGACHNCKAAVEPTAVACHACGASFVAEGDRDHLGLAPIRALPGDPPPPLRPPHSAPHSAPHSPPATSAPPTSSDTPAPTPAPATTTRNSPARSPVGASPGERGAAGRGFPTVLVLTSVIAGAVAGVGMSWVLQGVGGVDHGEGGPMEAEAGPAVAQAEIESREPSGAAIEVPDAVEPAPEDAVSPAGTPSATPEPVPETGSNMVADVASEPGESVEPDAAEGPDSRVFVPPSLEAIAAMRDLDELRRLAEAVVEDDPALARAIARRIEQLRLVDVLGSAPE